MFWFYRYSFCNCYRSPCTYSSCWLSFFARVSRSFLSWMCCCSSLLSFSHSFSCNSLLLVSSYFFFLSSFSSPCSRWYLSFSISLCFFTCSYYERSISYSLSACSLSSLAESSSPWSFVDSRRSASTWLHTSCSWVRDLFNLTANSDRIFSDIFIYLFWFLFLKN